MASEPRDRSLFWPIVLIGAGTIWLLVNYNVIPGFEWWQLLRLWPLFLIAAGLEILVGRSRPWVSALVGLLTVGAAVGLLVFGPQLGLTTASRALMTRQVEAPLEGVREATINLDLSSYATRVNALEDATRLIAGELTHASTGQVTFNTRSTDGRATVDLSYRETMTGPWDWFSGVEARWQIGLSPEAPLTLNVDVGSGSLELDLAQLQLRALDVDGGSGSVRLNLPPGGETAYAIRVRGGSGSNVVTPSADTHATLTYDGGSGSLTVNVPAGLAVRVEVRDSGSGSVSVPRGWEVMRTGSGDEGVWQTAGFDAASRRFTLIVEDLGSGSISVR
jgi:hypothetical protein